LPALRRIRWATVWLVRSTLLFIALAVLLPLVSVYWALLHPLPIVASRMPYSGGYEELLKAARELEGVQEPDFDTATVAEQEAFVGRCERALTRARKAMAQPCGRRLGYTDADLRVEGLSGIRSLAYAMAAEAGLAKMNGRPGDALALYTDILRLGQASSAGGLIVDWLLGMAVHGVGMDRLASLRKQLSVAQCRDLLERLQSGEFALEPMEDVWLRDWAWEEHVYGWQCRLCHLPARLIGFAGYRTVYEEVVRRSEATRRLLVIGLAIECHRHEKGHPPAKLAELVPHYLSALPTDPFTDQPLQYRLEGSEYVLYSVGPDRDDNGGLLDWTQSVTQDGDMLLDPPTQPASTGERE
jgi:hypothetical protein